jgi:hypothetical protein
MPASSRSRALLTLGGAAAAWVVFLLGELSLHLRLGLAESLLPRDYPDRFFGLFFVLLSLLPLLVTFVALAVRRRQLGLPAGLAIAIAYVAANYGLLWLVRPFFATGFPG